MNPQVQQILKEAELAKHKSAASKGPNWWVRFGWKSLECFKRRLWQASKNEQEFREAKKKLEEIF